MAFSEVARSHIDEWVRANVDLDETTLQSVTTLLVEIYKRGFEDGLDSTSNAVKELRKKVRE